MAITVATLQVNVTANNAQFNTVLNQTQNSLTGFQSLSNSVTESISSSFLRAGGLLTAAVTAPIVAISEMGRAFETELRRVAANTAMTDAELAKMRETVMDLGRNSAAPLADIAHGFEHAANFGFNAAESAKILDVAMQGAVATGAHTTDVTNTLAGVLHQFGMSADQASVTLNTLKEAAGKGNLTLEQMVAVSGRVFSTAANLGLSLNEAAGAMSALTRAGFPAAQASTQLVGALTHLVNPSKEVREELARLSKTSGIDLVHDFSQAGLQAKGFSGVLADVKKAVGDNTAEILKLFGGIRGGMGAMALAGNAADDYKNILNQLAETMSGKLTPIQDAYAREVNTLGFQFGELKNRLTLLGDALNNAFSGGQVNFVKQLNDAVDGLTRGFQSLDPAMQAAVTTFLGAFAISGPILLGAGALVTLIGGPLTIAIVGVTAALSILAADWLSDNDKAKSSTETLKQSLLELIPALGLVADIMGVVANASFIAWQSSTAQIKATIQVITGNWIGAMRTIDESNKIFSKGLGNIWDELNGKWEGVLNKLVSSAFSATSSFANAGRANAHAYISQFGIVGAGNPFSNITPPGGVAGPPTVSAMGQLTYPVDNWRKQAAAVGEDIGKHLAGGIGGGVKKHGAGISQALVDTFQGDGGFDRALDLIRANVSKLGSLLDPTTKQFRLQGQQIEKALSEAAKNVNEFLGAAGIKAKVTSTDIINNWHGLQGVLSKTDAFEHVKDAIEKINLDRVAAGFDTLDSTLVVSQGHILLSAQTLQALQEKFPPLTAEAQKAGVALQGSLLPIADKTKVVAAGFALLSEETKKTLGDMGKSTSEFSFDTKESLAKAGLSWKELVRGLPVEQLKAALKEMKAAVEGDPIFDAVKIKNEAAQWIGTIIGEFTREGERMGLTGEALMNHALEGLKKVAPSFPPLMKDVADKSVEQWKLSLYRLPGVWDEVFNKMSSGAKSWAASVFGVLDTIPGKFGSMVSKITNTVSSWIAFFDKILGLAHKFSNDFPASIGDAFSKIIGIFKGAQSGISSAANDILNSSSLIIKNFSGGGGAGSLIPSIATGSADATNALHELGHSGADSLGGLASSAQSAAGNFKNAAGSFMSSIGGIATAITGLAALYTSTFTSKSAVVRGVGGGASFGLLGALTSIFFGGPSKAEKELAKAQMAAQLQEAKDAIELSKEAVKQAITKTASDIADLMAKIADGTHVSKALIKTFTKDMGRLLDLLADEMKAVASKATPELKAAAENFAAVVALAGDAINVLGGLNSYVAPAGRIIDSFFVSLTAVITKFGELADTVPLQLAKHAGKFANKIKSAIELVGTAVTSFTGLVDFKGIPAEAFDLFKVAIALAVTKMAEIADSIDANMVKQASRFSDKAKSVADILKSGVDGLVAVAGFSGVPAAAFTAFGDGIKAAIQVFIKLADELSVDLLGRAVVIAQAVNPIAAALKAWAEASAAMKDYTQIANEKWDAVVVDFNRSIELMTSMLAQAIRFIPDAIRFEDTMKTIADHLKAGLGFITEGIQAAQSAFLGLVNVMSSPQNPINGGDGVGGDSVGANAFAGLSANHLGSSSSSTSHASTVYQVNVTINGSLIHQERVTDAVVDALVKAQRAGRLKTAIV